MALINCPECGKQISDKAKTCPECGYPISQEPQQPSAELEYEDGAKKGKKKKKHGMSVFLRVVFGLVLLASGTISILKGLGIDFSSETQPGTSVSQEFLSADEIREMYIDPVSFKGRPVELYGKILISPEYDKNGVEIQMYTDIENLDKNTLVVYDDTSLDLKDGDYIHVIGKVAGKATGTNIIRGTVSIPKINAETIEISTYKDAVRPTMYSYSPTEPTQTQHGYSVTVEVVELAEAETRVYFKVENNGTDKFNLLTYSAIILQNGKQYEKEYNYYADYQELQSDIAVGVTSEGVVCFPAIENDDFQIVVEGYSDWTVEFEPYTFDVAVTANQQPGE